MDSVYRRSIESHNEQVTQNRSKCCIIQSATYITEELDLHFESCPEKVIAQTYDGASVMAGSKGEVQAIIKEKYASAQYIHCHAHQLNLIMLHAASINRSVRVFFVNLQGIFTFFSNSPQRMAILDEVVGKRLPRAVPTRLNFQSRSVNTVYEYRLELLECMEVIQTGDRITNDKTILQASGYKGILSEETFIYWLSFFHKIMPYVDILFNQLQKRDTNPNLVETHIQAFEREVRKIRENICTESYGEEMTKRRRVESLVERKRETHEICDVILREIKDRFSFKGHLGASTLFRPDTFEDFHNVFPEESLRSVIRAYPFINERNIRTELSIKTFLRSTMSENRLSALAMLSIERHFILSIVDFNQRVIEKFARNKGDEPVFYINRMHRVERLRFANDHRDWRSCVLFTDESRFNLCSPDGRERVWRRRENDFHSVISEKPYGGGEVMVWALYGCSYNFCEAPCKADLNNFKSHRVCVHSMWVSGVSLAHASCVDIKGKVETGSGGVPGSPSPSVTPPPQTCDENAVALIEEIERLKKELDEERKTTLVLNFKLEAAERKLQQHRTKINNLWKELIACKKKERCAHNIHNKLVDGLSDIFTKTQIKVLTNKQKRVNWTDKDISAAFTLRYLGKKTYIYMRQKLHYPLPGLSTLEKWASKIDMRNGTGILEDMLGMMKIAAITYGQSDKIAVLQFDEVHVKRAYEYDSLKDEIVGPHSRLQAVMTGCRVAACVCDMGAANQGLWKGYEVNPTKTWFYNPRTSERIYFFADAPHLLKLVRNWLLDTDLIFSNGKIVSKEPLESLIKDDNHEIKACHKIDSSHLNCRGTERMNVRKAAELMSHSVATALRHFKLGGDSSITENTSEFIEIVNNWFDLMNSYSPAHSKVPSKNAYGLKLEEQDNILKNMCDTINSMTCRGKRVKQVFQTAILVPISSLKYLLLDVQKLGMTYILTHRLNQDSLENLFSQIRSRGGLYDHPTPLNSLYRLRMIILGNNAGNIEKHKNTHTESSEEYLSSQLLRTCGVKCTDLVQNSIPDIFIQEEDDTSGSGSTIVGEKETEMEVEGLRYIAGWIASKHSETHPNLGHRTDTEETDHSSYCLVSWIRSLSYGGLTEPTSKWLDIAFVLVMDLRFEEESEL
ncbi:hypothetical protein ANN_08681 [Periplaneta americana]|uniref:Transposable element P transposase n=1 Tax=Periplaneta americana TaxID=6978 RepID=A0ABQ8T3R5_PERAM|nr:hypothetical protein ANN_08681 [Periplaneta americana]